MKETHVKIILKRNRIIKPKIICILGNTAFNSLLDGKEIIKFRGK